jgi:hypothetical protein
MKINPKSYWPKWSFVKSIPEAVKLGEGLAAGGAVFQNPQANLFLLCRNILALLLDDFWQRVSSVLLQDHGAVGRVADQQVVAPLKCGGAGQARRHLLGLVLGVVDLEKYFRKKLAKKWHFLLKLQLGFAKFESKH